MAEEPSAEQTQEETAPAPAETTGDVERSRKRSTRRAFLKGAAVGGAGMWAAAVIPRSIFSHDPHRPPKLYEYFLDNFWFESVGLYEERINAPLKGRQQADMAILGGGYAGMATAYNLARRYPEKRIVLLEGACCGYGASGRNGGLAGTGFWGVEEIFYDKGPEAARAYYDATVVGLEQIKTLVNDHGVACDLELNGSMSLAAAPEHVEWFEEEKRRFDAMGLPCKLLDKAELGKSIQSERFHGALYDPHKGILNPAKLARGMKRVIEELGVEVFERSKVMRIEPGARLRIVTEFGELVTPQAVLTLNGYAPQIGVFAQRVMPLMNYVVATEPLSDGQMASIGWAGREGLSDTRVQFMYFRLTADNRIVFGGEMSPYFYGSSLSSGNYRPAVDKLQRSILTTFPQLQGVRFTHSWGGTMGFTLNFQPAIGVLGDHKNLFYAVGFCGEGVVMTQLAGRILAQLIAGEQTELTRLPFVNTLPPYLGHEPIRYPGMKLYEKMLTRLGSV